MENENKQTIEGEVVDKGKDLPMIMTASENDLQSLVEQADKQVQYIKKIKILSIKATNEDDWVKQDDKPYLEHIGTFKVRQLWKVDIFDMHIEKENLDDEQGKFILFTCYGKARFMNKEIDDIGACSTRDDFFGRAHGQLKDIEQVDIESVKKKSVTNFQNRILKKILGLSFTWDDLKSAGLDITKIKSVEYKKTVTEEDKKLQDELKAILKEVFASDLMKGKEWLVKNTEFMGKDKDGKPEPVKGIDTCERLTGKRLEICMHKAHELKREYDKNVSKTDSKTNGGEKK
jgi:hypothetical protein